MLRLPLERNGNHNGIVSANSLFPLAECAAVALFLNRYGDDVIAPICASINIRCRRAAKSDLSLTLTISDEQFDKLEVQVMAEGKVAVEFEQKLEHANGEVVAIAQVNYVLLKI